MEFIEYYQLIRRRLMIPVLLGVLGAVVVALLQVLPPTQYKAQGQMLAQPGTSLRVQWSGSEVNVVNEDDMWGTLQQVAQSRIVAEQAAAAAGLDLGPQLKGLVFDRPTKGNAFSITGSAPSPDLAETVTNNGMKALARLWDATRLQRLQTVSAELNKRYIAIGPARTALQSRLDLAEAGSPPGKPTDVLVAVQSQISQIQGARAAALTEVSITQDRLATLQDFARRELSAPPEQRLMLEPIAASNAASLNTAGLETKLADLTTLQLKMLQTRTLEHPEVKALQADIDNTRKQLSAAEKERQRVSTRLSPSLQSSVMVAQMDLKSAQRRAEVLASQEVVLRTRIPELQARSRLYQDLVDHFAPLDAERESIIKNLSTVNNEMDRLRGSDDLQILDPAKALPAGKTPGKQLAMVVAGGFGGFVIGLILIFVIYYIDPGTLTTVQMSGGTKA